MSANERMIGFPSLPTVMGAGSWIRFVLTITRNGSTRITATKTQIDLPAPPDGRPRHQSPGPYLPRRNRSRSRSCLVSMFDQAFITDIPFDQQRHWTSSGG